ncbi:MAG: hypothetical protein SGBAC_007484 [Bacillariaceae sp.]
MNDVRIADRGAGIRASCGAPAEASQSSSNSLLQNLTASFLMPQNLSYAGGTMQRIASNRFGDRGIWSNSGCGVGGVPVNTCTPPLVSPLDPSMLASFDARQGSLSQIRLDTAPPRSEVVLRIPFSAPGLRSAAFPNLAQGAPPCNPVHSVTEDHLLRFLCAKQSPSAQVPTPRSGATKPNDMSKRSSDDTKKPPKKRSKRNPEDSITATSPSYRPYQERQWLIQFEELLKFKALHGHCRIPNACQNNSSLSRWVKRQRYQYKLKQEKKISTLSDERVKQLEEVGFVWDYHAEMWEERRAELEEFKGEFGDCNVPSHYPKNRKLSAWVKCQRRQYKRFIDGDSSSMTGDRFGALERMGFTWKVRGSKDGKASLSLDLV